jgi:hypothetical protein
MGKSDMDTGWGGTPREPIRIKEKSKNTGTLIQHICYIKGEKGEMQHG